MEHSFTLTEVAVKEVSAALKKRKTPDASLRIGVRGGGCSGYRYHLEFCDDPPGEKDLIFAFINADDDEEVRVFIDKKSIIYLTGSELDWEKTLVRQGYKFNNPNVKKDCGCQESFEV